MRVVSAALFVPIVAGCGLVLDLDPDDAAPAADGGLVDAGPADGGAAMDGSPPVDAPAPPADAGFDAALVRPEVCGGLSCLRDGFPEAERNPVWAEYAYPDGVSGGSAAQTGGVLTVTPATGVENAGHGYVSLRAYDARTDRVSVEIRRAAQAPAQTYLILRYGAQDSAGMLLQSGTMILFQLSGGTVVERHEVSFMADDQPWWQLKGEGGRLYFEVSGDGSDFVTLFDIEAPPWLVAAHVELGVNVQSATSAPVSADFDNLNLDPGRVLTPYCPSDEPMDGFDDATVDPHLWSTSPALGVDESCTVTEGDGVVTLSGTSTDDEPCGMGTRHAYDLSFGVFLRRAEGSPARALVFGVLDAARRRAIVGCYESTLYFSMPDGTIRTWGACPEEPYWRLALVEERIELGVADGVGGWRTVATAPRGMLDATAVHLGFSLAPSRVAGAATSVSVESFNQP